MPNPLRTLHRILRSFLRLAAPAALALAALSASPTVARAQTITIPNAPASLGRVSATGGSVNLRGQNNYPYGISLSDCVNDYSITFPVTLTGINANMALEMWAGTTDCSDYTQRQNTTQTCWKVANNANLTLNQTISIRVRDVIAQPAIKTQTYVNQNDSVCGKVDFTTFSVYFLLTQGSTTTLANAKQEIQADTIGPAAVSNVHVDQGDTRLHVTWSAVGTSTDEAGASSTSTTTATQVAIYYQEAGSGGSSTDAGTTLSCSDGSVTVQDAGVDDSGDAQTSTTTADGGCELVPVEATSGSCAAPGFKSTGPDDSVSHFTVGANSSETTINDLVNGTTYAVAVTAQDAFLNPGTISSLACQSPVQLNDFFETYRSDGGQAGGSCSLDLLGAPAGGASVAVVAFSGLLALARRRRRHTPDHVEDRARAPREGQEEE